ncbi:hypothetical protein OHB44_10225 [Micromonospora sp. NBC_00821]|uniref:hypothetical protein n=1 Tax=Micromonospora sp. NBC_00821 TaxID=2975977 RepID=UPI002ED68282|nr:hypothetical protein OHB44_10225 [Micromonospora sp. NBC_00821]
MDQGAGETNFLRLLRLAFEEITRDEPVVVAADSGPPLSHGWQSRSGTSPADLARLATSLLPDRPVLLIPSWARLVTPEGPRNAFEVTLVGIEPTTPESVLAVVLPSGALASVGGEAFREQVSRLWQPMLLLYADFVPDGWHAGLSLTTVFLAARPSDPKPLRFFRIPPQGDEQAMSEDFATLLRRKSGTSSFGYVLADQPGAGEGLSFDLNHPDTTRRWKELGVWGTPVPLGDLFDTPAPGVMPGRDRPPAHDEPQPHTVRVLSGRDVRRDGTLAGPDDSSRYVEVPPDRQLKAGDIVLPRHFSAMVGRNVAVAEVTEGDLPLAASHTVVILREAMPLSRPQRLMALLFLRASPLVRTYLDSSRGHVRINTPVFRRVPVPQPDETLTATLEGLEAARNRLQQWHNESEGLLSSVFHDENAADARRRIMQSGRLLRMRADAANLLDDFSHQVRTRYPHPVAYRWSRAQVLLSKGADGPAYDAILEAAEVLLCYCALVALALAQEADLRIGATTDLRKRLSRGGTNGPGFGDWTAILQEVATGKAFRNLVPGDQLTDFRDAFTGTEVIAARQGLALRRNDEAHLRGVEVEDLPDAIAEAHADLTTLLQRASFLADLPLVYVNHVRWDSLRRVASVEFEELTGDNVLVAVRERTYGSSDLEAGSLYLATEDGRLHLLRPFLIRRRCAKCRSWETLHIDSVPQIATVQIKSLERGHTIQDPQLWDAFKHVGLVERPGN